ncbi:hypothetical protein SLU01_07290 [Sporosarcina luteola]|uniref:Copper amine oxidase-like N-terminal domain-containing protein n=1 Tax=Sporosarcina luteola TaxID=582850 RepID=A0A511Z4P8_9BACL|nr:DUF6612 family protein [Sporosarcina luteola]GEN82417.1 hypothetical protein SLU01_07290 [Sporosarcina luteola]
MRKLATWVLAFVFVLSFAWPSMTASAQDGAMKLVVDGVEVEGYENAFMSQDKILIPVDDLFKEAGFKVTKEAPGKLNVTNTYLTLDFSIADQQITVNGEATNEVFPLTLRNYGNYISSDFLNSLEGFEVTVSEDTVNVTTNRVQDVDAFLEKMLAADLKSYAAKMTLDQSMEADSEEFSMNMLMDMDMSMTTEPISMHMKQSLSMTMGEEKEEVETESYFTKDGFFMTEGDEWTKFPAQLTDGLLEATMAQADPLAQMEMMKAFMKGIHVFEYDDVYIVVQTMTNDEFKEMMEEAMSLITGLIPGLNDDSVSDVEATLVEETTSEEEATTEEDATAVEEEAVTEETVEAYLEEGAEDIDLGSILEMLNINIDEFYSVTVLDKATLFPQSVSGTTVITMSMDGETVTITQLIEGIYSQFNAVKTIEVPADVIENAVVMEYDEVEAVDVEEETTDEAETEEEAA